MANPPAESLDVRSPFEILDPRDADDVRSVLALAARAADVDGQPPFSDQTLIDARSGARTLVAERSVETGEIASVAAVSIAAASPASSPGDAAPAEAEAVVDPDERRRGHGARLLDEVLRVTDHDALLWAHGDHPGARALARSRGLAVTRELLQLRLDPVEQNGTAADVRPFRVGVDDSEWLAVNAAAFASHPEQGKLTQADLDARIAEPWFDADDFLVARDDGGAMIGFCWLKTVDGIGEFYAVGVAPEAQGSGLGRRLVESGLARLVARGIRTSSLYVDGDNVAAVSLYRSVGFVDHTIDVQYAPTPTPPLHAAG
ncbi:mycothiol synthase [Marisediminicola sp. LYQ85]|uniref:mycothiol synthase n=1 Tax=Marisediminicola sp. LYQ85 TaxID=3391062 RepID=UPI0039835E9B